MTAIMPLGAAAPTRSQIAPLGDDELLAKARQFEASFLSPMVDEMLRTAGKATFGAGNSEEIWRSFLAGAIAEQIAQSDTTGIAPGLAQQMKAYGG